MHVFSSRSEPGNFWLTHGGFRIRGSGSAKPLPWVNSNGCVSSSPCALTLLEARRAACLAPFAGPCSRRLDLRRTRRTVPSPRTTAAGRQLRRPTRPPRQLGTGRIARCSLLYRGLKNDWTPLCIELAYRHSIGTSARRIDNSWSFY